jgi:hypothetical protein
MFTLLANVSIAQTNAPKRNVDDLTDEEITLFLDRAQSSGMTEMQIEKAAKAQGYTPSDIAKMRARIANTQTAGNNSANGGDDETGDSNDPYDKNNAKDDDGSSLSHSISDFLIAAFMLVPAAQQRLILQPVLEMLRKWESAVVVIAAADEQTVALEAWTLRKQMLSWNFALMNSHFQWTQLQRRVQRCQLPIVTHRR